MRLRNQKALRLHHGVRRQNQPWWIHRVMPASPPGMELAAVLASLVRFSSAGPKSFHLSCFLLQWNCFPFCQEKILLRTSLC